MNAFGGYIPAYTLKSHEWLYTQAFASIHVYLSRRVLINLDNKKTFIVYWAITSILNLLIYHQVNCGKQIACLLFLWCYIFFSHNFLFLFVYITCIVVIPSRRVVLSGYYIFIMCCSLWWCICQENVALRMKTHLKWCTKKIQSNSIF